MLVLSRKVGEGIVVDERIVVRVERISENRVRLSFEGINGTTGTFPVRRQELPPKKTKKKRKVVV